jgi:prolyl-tRNA editing enzyme YbaK/EbsC (Cys-tRNA(Pro) deacylase)
MSDHRAEAFAARMAERGVVLEPREMDDTTHTAQDAATALGCDVAAIVKSLVFLAGEDESASPVLVLASGSRRVDTELVSQLLDKPVRMADAKTVKIVTGSSIGGVPPFGHPRPLPTILDEGLLELEEVWAAAASARSVFPISPVQLGYLTGASVAKIG